MPDADQLLVLVYCPDEQRAAELRAILETAGWATAWHAQEERLWPEIEESGGRKCLLVDCTDLPSPFHKKSPTSNGGLRLPVVAIVPRGDVRAAVTALHWGALNAVEFPLAAGELLACVREATELGWPPTESAKLPDVRRNRLKELSPSEMAVLEGVVNGKPNKSIAAELGVSLRTVELRRAKLMKALEVNSLAELIRLVISDVPTCS